jgi:hypothetical protein
MSTVVFPEIISIRLFYWVTKISPSAIVKIKILLSETLHRCRLVNKRQKKGALVRSFTTIMIYAMVSYPFLERPPS